MRGDGSSMLFGLSHRHMHGERPTAASLVERRMEGEMRKTADRQRLPQRRMLSSRSCESLDFLIENEIQQVVEEVATAMEFAYMRTLGLASSEREYPPLSDDTDDEEDRCSIVNELRHLSALQESIRDELLEADDSYHWFPDHFFSSRNDGAESMEGSSSNCLLTVKVPDDESVATAFTDDETVDQDWAHESTRVKVAHRTTVFQPFEPVDGSFPIKGTTRLYCESARTSSTVPSVGQSCHFRANVAGNILEPGVPIEERLQARNNGNYSGSLDALRRLAIPLFVVPMVVDHSCLDDAMDRQANSLFSPSQLDTSMHQLPRWKSMNLCFSE
jgi:hypothetical protein